MFLKDWFQRMIIRVKLANKTSFVQIEIFFYCNFFVPLGLLQIFFAYFCDTHQLFLQADLKIFVFVNRNRDNLSFFRVSENMVTAVNSF